MKKLDFKPQPIDKEELIERLFSHPYLGRFFVDNDLNSRIIESYLPTLLAYEVESNNCTNCVGLHACKQDMLGHEPLLQYVNGKIKLYYHQCSYMKKKQEARQNQSRLTAMYMPKIATQATITDYDTTTDTRMQLYRDTITFVRDFGMNEPVKGFYIYGEYKKGKTYTLAMIANELKNNGHKVILAYYPDLVREFKSSLSDNSIESLVSKLKQVDVLLLDDIGGEAGSAWVRDEVLGPILQHRLLDEKPTFFSSNADIKSLASFMKMNDSKEEKIKAYRVITRIEQLTEDHLYKM